ncbi:hypothetical protein AJ80_01415 [Polytolypa hystricis UAMH7299]|uniref:Ketoreductase (KR) domain-containing protein n=1 Tax=Polytolypa hystricis (strain UAMH7299) TaxID=1447883 RepID=A0A2B7YZR3_POLH7|nr:hypothetical protein AJ80_01415 [Polytolypa hystricis UAMH7299]
MPIPFIAQTAFDGLSSIPYAYSGLKVVACLCLIALLKSYFGGAQHTADGVLHSKVIMITGGTSGIGSSIAADLAQRGAQIILLTKYSPSDLFLVEYIEDLRAKTNNELIYAEQVDLSSLHSIRLFATKWVDNAPPRRLDMVILCASTQNPRSSSGSGKTKYTVDGLDEEWQVNYLANYHLLSILSPALRAQPPDRDVRVIFAGCAGYIGGKLDFNALEEYTSLSSMAAGTTTTSPKSKKSKPSTSSTTISRKPPMFATSKLALLTFARSFQSHLSAYSRPDKQPPNARVLVVDPGLSRTPGTRRWITRGSLWGLLVYLLTWPLWWLILKSPQQGAQSFLMAVLEMGFSAEAVHAVSAAENIAKNAGNGDKKRATSTTAAVAAVEDVSKLAGVGMGIEKGKIIKECKERDVLRPEIMDDNVAKELWEFSERQIEAREKEGAVLRALEKKEREAWEKEKKEKEKEKEQAKGNGGEGIEVSGSKGNKTKAPGSRRSRKAK